jgi:Tfp pilus assembly protein PilX
MRRGPSSERGQVLVIIVLVMFGLIGITGLAIDGSRAYSDRRQAQNAADTAAMAAALSYIRYEDVDLMKEVGWERAASNSYDNNESTNFVEVNYPPDERSHYFGSNEHVQVIITSHLGTLLGRVVGIEQVTNTVQAVARLTPSKKEPMYGGNALVSLNKTACSALNYQGGASLTVNGSGIFSNSNCTSTSNGAFNTNTGSGTITVPCLTAVGTITTGTNTNLNTNGCQHSEDESLQIQDPFSIFPYPEISCGTELAEVQPDGTTMSPGYWSGAFPPAGVKNLQPGIYCLDTKNHGFTLNAGQELVGNGIVIYMLSGKVSWSSGGVHLSAPTTKPYPGLLLYVSYKNPSNCSEVTLNGNGTSTFVGSILAPCSNVKLTGGSGGSGYNNQIIADTITLSGNTNIVINFDANKQWKPPTYPTVELTH